MDKAISFIIGFAGCNLIRSLYWQWAKRRPLKPRESSPGD